MDLTDLTGHQRCWDFILSQSSQSQQKQNIAKPTSPQAPAFAWQLVVFVETGLFVVVYEGLPGSKNGISFQGQRAKTRKARPARSAWPYVAAQSSDGQRSRASNVESFEPAWEVDTTWTWGKKTKINCKCGVIAGGISAVIAKQPCMFKKLAFSPIPRSFAPSSVRALPHKVRR